MRVPLAACALCALIATAACQSLPYHLSVNPDRVVGVDVVLQPDATFATRTGEDTSHITLVRRFVRASDLQHVGTAVANVMATTRLASLDLRATGLAPAQAGTPAGALAIDASPDFRRLEERMVGALRPFVVDPETVPDFIATPDGSRMSDATIKSVTQFVPNHSGVNYRPQASGGSSAGRPADAQSFEAFSFRPAGAALYQIGGDGHADRLLWVWTGEPGAREP